MTAGRRRWRWRFVLAPREVGEVVRRLISASYVFF
jgi:hypothetical protein